MPLLQLSDVYKSHGTGSEHMPVLRDINMHVDRGEVVAIVGYSGTGKTTLMSLMAGLTRPDQGQVLMRGESVVSTSSERGLVFQNYSLLPWLSVLDNVMLAVQQVFSKESFQVQVTRAKAVIDLVKLSAASEKRPSELSGGMRQRVSLARALVTEPTLLLLDEPLSALDALTRLTLQSEIVSIVERRSSTVCMITNDVDEALLMADRVIPLLPSAHDGATLGQPIAIPLPRPRNRSSLMYSPEFKRLKRQTIDVLTQARRQSMAAEGEMVTL